MRFLVLYILCIGIWSELSGQKEYHVVCIAFYNFENLFDTLDSPDTEDFEFTPHGPNAYNSSVYWDKLSKLARVVSEIGTETTPDGPALLGVSEIENITVLEDFIRQPAIAERRYQILHQDSKDSRGVDVALLYQPKYFIPDEQYYYSLPVGTDSEGIRYSRDILYVTGRLLGEPVVVTVNHWPSRRGGEQMTSHLREAAAYHNRHFLDSLATFHQIDKGIVMGDLNDDPVNDSVRKGLRAGRFIDRLQPADMYNPFEDFFRKGNGTTAYQDAWSLFDQIILTSAMVTTGNGLHYYKAGIFKPDYLTQKTGKFKGYPMRSYSSGKYTGGFSDHFPVYVFLVKEKG